MCPARDHSSAAALSWPVGEEAFGTLPHETSGCLSTARRAAALAWQRNRAAAIAAGRRACPADMTIRQAGERWLEGIKRGTITTKSGRRFKAATIIRECERRFWARVVSVLGGMRLGDVTGRCWWWG
jgi:hypothetical protein